MQLKEMITTILALIILGCLLSLPIIMILGIWGLMGKVLAGKILVTGAILGLVSLFLVAMIDS